MHYRNHKAAAHQLHPNALGFHYNIVILSSSRCDHDGIIVYYMYYYNNITVVQYDYMYMSKHGIVILYSITRACTLSR